LDEAWPGWSEPAGPDRPRLARPQAQAPLELRLADVGRFAAFVDMGGVAWTGRTARLRVLQVAEDGFTAGTEAFWGGWRYEVLDCDARTIAHAGFSSVRVGGKEGPVSGDLRPADGDPGGQRGRRGGQGRLRRPAALCGRGGGDQRRRGRADRPAADRDRRRALTIKRALETRRVFRNRPQVRPA
jgi:hypothetical protein